MDKVRGLIKREKPEDILDMINGFFDNSEEKRARVIIETDSYTRSQAQNSLYWVWLRTMGNHFGYSEEDMDVVLRERFFGVETVKTPAGRKVHKHQRTSSLTVSEFSEYLTKIDHLALDHGVVLQRPADLYYKAQGVEGVFT